MNKIVKHFLAAAIFVLGGYQANAQLSNPGEVAGSSGNRIVSTAVPFLNISPNARAAGMGDVGVATAPDANSSHFNPAKLAFIKSNVGFSLSYTPWLRTIIDDMSVSYLSGYKKIDDQQAISASLRYFDMGTIIFTDFAGNETGEQFVPREFALDASYARKLSEKLSLGVSARFIYSSLSNDVSQNNVNTRNGVSAAADIGMYYNQPLVVGGLNSDLALGMAITNIGSKISYTSSNTRDFIPTTLKLGAAYTANFDPYNKLTIAFDANKLMVPTPNPNDSSALNGEGPSLLSGMFGSFADAPNGASEEFKEIFWSTGLEYWYNDMFAARTGYFWEHAQKGGRKYVTMGIGLKYQVFGLDVAYLVPTDQQHPLAETLRFSLLFDMDKAAKKGMKKPAVN